MGSTRQVADGVWQVSGLFGSAVNTFVTEEALIDAGTRGMAKQLIRELRQHPVELVALTHVHPDHQGAAHAVCTELDLPLAVPETEAGRMDGSDPMPAKGRMASLSNRLFTGPPHPVARSLAEGEEISGFRLYHTPGHTRGHLVYFREADGLLIAGDALNGMNLMTGVSGLHRPPDFFNERPDLVNDSIRKLVELRPRTICFGHGPPLQDAADKLEAFAADLP